jgi:hypothetical protein
VLWHLSSRRECPSTADSGHVYIHTLGRPNQPTARATATIERFKRNGLWYGVVCVTMLAAIVLSSVYLASH